MKWEKVKLGDVSDYIHPGPFGSQLHRSDYSIDGIPIIMPKDMKDGKIVDEDLIRVDERHIERLKRHQVHENDIIFARKGDVSKCALITPREVGWLTGSDCLKVVLNKEKCYPLYIYCFLRSPMSKRWLEQHSIGATMPSLNTGILSEIEIKLPDRNTQIRVAGIISGYDNLIENNQKQIKLLEETAQRLYQEWFVKLRFPGHEKVKVVDGVPEGWKSCALGDVIDFNPKISVKKGQKKVSVPMSALSTTLMVIDSTQFTHTMSNAGSKFQNGDTLLARITPCLQNGKTGFVWGLDPEEVAVGSTEFIVMRSKSLNPYMVYLLARTDDFREYAIKSMTGSDGRQRAQTNKIELFPYCLPSVEIVNQFCDFVAPIFQTIFSLNCQCERLTEARDRLLPKLMSGEIEV